VPACEQILQPLASTLPSERQRITSSEIAPDNPLP
jgi:hypothetical protein